MSISFEEIKKYLPHYLSDTSQHFLFKELKDFPENIDQRLYSNFCIEKNLIYQGDGLEGLMVINLPETDSKQVPAIVLSNTCDVDKSNKRFFPTRLVYAPIFQLEKYHAMLIEELVKTSKYPEQKITDHILSIRKQFNTQILFLPKGANLENDSIVFLDRVNNYPLEDFPMEEIPKRRIFSLSNYGFYLFLVKLSIHFNRIREDVDRVMLN